MVRGTAIVIERLCACGQGAPRLTRNAIAALNRRRRSKIIVCPCGHEIKVPKTANETRPLAAINGRWAHRECAVLAREEAARGLRP